MHQGLHHFDISFFETVQCAIAHQPCCVCVLPQRVTLTHAMCNAPSQSTPLPMYIFTHGGGGFWGAGTWHTHLHMPLLDWFALLGVSNQQQQQYTHTVYGR